MFFFATINASVVLVAMACINVDAAATIALTISGAVIIHVAAVATTFYAATFDTIIATGIITSNDGHNTLLSRSA